MIDWLDGTVAALVQKLCGPQLAKAHVRLDAQRARADALERELRTIIDMHLQTRAALCVLAARVECLEKSSGEVVYTAVRA